MIKNRRVGTLAAGISMIIFGFLFLFRLVFPAITVRFIASLWPLVLVFLGIEILLAYVFHKDGQMKYDAGSVALIIMLALFTVCMSCAQSMMEYTQYGFIRN